MPEHFWIRHLKTLSNVTISYVSFWPGMFYVTGVPCVLFGVNQNVKQSTSNSIGSFLAVEIMLPIYETHYLKHLLR